MEVINQETSRGPPRIFETVIFCNTWGYLPLNNIKHTITAFAGCPRLAMLLYCFIDV